jgi:hypothetical protein
MAFNINITKKGNIDFEELNSLCGDIDRFYITIFPIIKNPFQKEQGIGLSINIKNDYSSFWNSFEPFLLNLVEKKYTVVELYNGETIDQNNIQLLKDMLE